MQIKYKEEPLKEVDSCEVNSCIAVMYMTSSSYRVCLGLLESVSADHTTENLHRLVPPPFLTSHPVDLGAL